jgi:hypothetical protein
MDDAENVVEETPSSRSVGCDDGIVSRALAEPLHGQLKFCFGKEDMLDAAQDDVIWDKRVQQHRCFSMEVNYDVTHTEVLPVGEEMRYFGEVTILLTNQLAYPAYTVFREDPLKNRGPRA